MPIIGSVRGGMDGNVVQEETGDTRLVAASAVHGRADDYFVLRVRGDSMYPEVLRAALSEYLAWKRANGYSEAYLFGGDIPLPLQSIRNHLNRYADAAGLKRIRIHGFRHSYVSMCAHLGATPVIIATLIGDTIETVNEVYTHIWAQDTNEIVSKINEICVNFVPHFVP